MKRNFFALLLSALSLPTLATSSTLDIQFQSPLAASESQRKLLSNAEKFWESTLVGYQPGIEIDSVNITVDAFGIDGTRGILAQAGPTKIVKQNGFVLPTRGVVEFDISDLERIEAKGTLFGILLHEVAHVLGFGTLWSNEVSMFGSGQYVGRNGLEAYRAEFDPTAEFIPVELDGGPGTRDSHWDENWAGGPLELMTGYVDPPLFLSKTTIASFRDLGYTAPYDMKPVPLPAGIWLGLAGFGVMGAFRSLQRRRSQAIVPA